MSARTLTLAFLALAGPISAQSTLPYYFAHIAAGGPWRTTFTLLNQTNAPVTCNTSFFSDTGAPLALPFNGASLSQTADTIPAGGLARRQTDAQPTAPTATGWAVAECSAPVAASALFRSYQGAVAQAEASVFAMSSPATDFVTYADQATGVAYANPSKTAATITFTARDSTGALLATKNISLAAGAHGSQNLGPLLGLATFHGSITITSSVAILSLSLNAEAAPIISSLPAGQPDGTAATTYYFPHIAAANVWRTTFTYVNASTQAVNCHTSFFADTGAPLALSFNGSPLTSATDVIPPGGVARRQTDAQPNTPVTTGWAQATCTGPVKASTLFREYDGSVPQAEASVIAAWSPASQFITYADQATGVALANPGPNPAQITFTAHDSTGAVAGTASQTLAPNAHTSTNLGPLLGTANFQGSVTVTSSQPIVSLSLNAEAYPSFSSLPPGNSSALQVYGAWHCSNDQCTWRNVRTVAAFDSRNHWLIDRGDGSGLPSVNLVVLSFVQPLKLLNLTNDAQTANGIPIGMTPDIVNYFTTHNVRVMLSIGGATYTTDWDQALATNAALLGMNAAHVAQSLGVGIEIDYENETSPNLPGLQAFIVAYRSLLPYDPTGANPAARLTIDLAAGDQSLIPLCTKATKDWLAGPNPVIDYANATVTGSRLSTADTETDWAQHVGGKPNYNPPIVPLAPALFTGAVYLELKNSAEPECNNFGASLENTTGNFVQTLAPNGTTGITPGMLGYMFWGAEAQAPATCQGGIGVGAANYNIPIPMPPLRRQ
jgi:hypothetical protein